MIEGLRYRFQLSTREKSIHAADLNLTEPAFVGFPQINPIHHSNSFSELYTLRLVRGNQRFLY